MKPITIELPIPPKEVRPNGRPHYMARANAVKKMRFNAEMTTYSVGVFKHRIGKAPGWTHARIRIDWYHPTKRFLDRDNIIASCKAYIDGLVDAELLADDRDVTYEPVGRFKDSKNPRIEITVTPTQEPDDE